MPVDIRRQDTDIALDRGVRLLSVPAVLLLPVELCHAPLLRPLWYDWPHAPQLYTIADAFLLGSDLLVAPVLDSGIVARDVVLPPGDWVDGWTGTAASGALHQWPAPCPGIPLFVRAHRHELRAALAGALARVRRGTVAAGSTTATWHSGLNRDLNVTG